MSIQFLSISREIHNLSGKSDPVLGHLHGKEVLPRGSSSGGTSCASVCVHCLLSYCSAALRKTLLRPVDTSLLAIYTAFPTDLDTDSAPAMRQRPAALSFCSPLPARSPRTQGSLMAPEPAPRRTEPQPRPALLAGAAGAERCPRPLSPRLAALGKRRGVAAAPAVCGCAGLRQRPRAGSGSSGSARVQRRPS